MPSLSASLPRFSLLVLSTLAAACSSSSNSASYNGAAGDPPPAGGASVAERAIAEADIIQLDSSRAGARLFAMSKSGTVSIVDVSTPAHLALLAQTRLAGRPFEMYRRGNFLITMANAAVDVRGSEYTAQYQAQPDPNSSSLVSVLDSNDPGLRRLGTLSVPGEIADSRIVGDVLYLASYENAACYRCSTKPRTLVTSFDISDASNIRQVDQASFESNAPDSYNLAWGTNWKRSIFVTDQRLYIGGHADIDPSTYNTYGQTSANEGIIDVLDITDPHGKLGHGARLSVGGAILSRWQMDELGGVFRVVSQAGAGRTGNGTAMPQVATFRVASAESFTKLGLMTLKLPRQEGLRTVRFDGTRAYAITYNQTDPLFTIDLSDPAAPVQRGELFMPGFMFHLEPHGDRVIGLGIDRGDPQGSLNVSLFDVSDMAHPTMMKRASFATAHISEDYEILNSEVAEDQDRIQKAFRVLPFPGLDQGLVVVPFDALVPQGKETCANPGGGVQLIAWTNDTLEKKALLPVPGNPRRAFTHNGEIITVSDSNVRSFSAADIGVATQTADVVIGECIPKASSTYYGGGAYNDGYYGRGYGACSAAGANDPRGMWGAAFIGLAVLLGRSRRRR
jgi:MYXO-CTERM domain-containing protein